MSFTMFFVILAVAFVVFIVFHKLGKSKRPVRRAFLSMLSGAAALAAVNITGFFTGVYLPISLLSLTVSLVGGIPGVTALLALNLFF